MPIKSNKYRYEDYQSYKAVKKLVNPLYKKQYFDINLSKQNYQNTLKHIYLSTKLSVLTMKIEDLKKLSSTDIERSQNMVNNQYQLNDKNQNKLDKYQQEEENHLNQVIEFFDNKKTSQNDDELLQEMLKLYDKLKKINEKNTKRINYLKKIVKQELESQNYQQLYVKNEKVDNIIKKTQLTKFLQPNDQQQIYQKYLKNLIIHLENMQLIESIICIRNVKLGEKKEMLFEVLFEETLKQNEAWINSKLILDLDKQRESSLFVMYNIPQKGRKSYISQNFEGFNSVVNKNHSQYSKGYNLTQIIQKYAAKYKENNSEDDVEMDKYTICHHCKNFFEAKYLVTCNYRSSIMGQIIMNNQYTERTNYSQEYSQNGIDQKLPKRQALFQIHRKKNNYTHYIKSNGELYCMRKYCRACLKQNYDQNIQKVLIDKEWICPFCQGSCFCSRCLRNDMIIRLKSMYLYNNGNLKEIYDQSLLEKYIQPLYDDNDFNFKKRKHLFQNSTFSTDELLIKQKIRQHNSKLRDYDKLKKLRLNMEKVRLIASQVLRREKLKIQLNSIIEQENDSKIQKLLGKKEKQKKKKKDENSDASEEYTEETKKKVKKNLDNTSNKKEKNKEKLIIIKKKKSNSLDKNDKNKLAVPTNQKNGKAKDKSLSKEKLKKKSKSKSSEKSIDKSAQEEKLEKKDKSEKKEKNEKSEKSPKKEKKDKSPKKEKKDKSPKKENKEKSPKNDKKGKADKLNKKGDSKGKSNEKAKEKSKERKDKSTKKDKKEQSKERSREKSKEKHLKVSKQDKKEKSKEKSRERSKEKKERKPREKKEKSETREKSSKKEKTLTKQQKEELKKKKSKKDEYQNKIKKLKQIQQKKLVQKRKENIKAGKA